jgi:D-xylose transport system substrate-binding protein
VLIADAKSDALVQYNQAIDFINKGVDVLVITVANANTAAAIVREAHKKNVKVIAYDGLIYNSDLDYLVGFDLERVGRLLGEYVLDKKPEGNYVIFNGDKAHAAAEEINTGLMEIIKPSIESKKINVVYNGWMEGWSGVNSEFYTEKVLEFSGEDIDVFVAVNDNIASGIARELTRRNYKKSVIITGQDGELSACNRIMNDKQSMSVYKSCKLIGNAAAELAYNIATGNEPAITETRFNGRKEVPAIILDPNVADKSNIEQIIVSDGAYTMQEILSYSVD